MLHVLIVKLATSHWMCTYTTWWNETQHSDRV